MAVRLSSDQIAKLSPEHRALIAAKTKKAGTSDKAPAKTSGSGAKSKASAAGAAAGGAAAKSSSGGKKSGGFKLPAMHFKSGKISQHAVATEFLVTTAIIGVRAMADYTPADDEHQPGKVDTPSGLDPLPLFAINCVAYFLLSLLSGSSKVGSRIAPVIGGIWILVLCMNSESEVAEVVNWMDSLGATSKSPTVTSSAKAGLSAAASTAASAASSAKAGLSGAPNAFGSGSATGNALSAGNRAVQNLGSNF